MRCSIRGAAIAAAVLTLALAACGSTSKSTHNARPAAKQPASGTTSPPAATTPAVTFQTISTPTAPAAGTAAAGSQTATDPTTTPALGSGTPAVLPAGDVALVGATPISLKVFDHWERIAAVGQTQGQKKGTPVIVPDYPTFKHCIAQARALKGLRHARTSVLRTDCKQLFTTLSTSVMDYLIKSVWYELAAAQAGIAPTPAQVQQGFERVKTAQFHTEAAFQRFLVSTGQTMADVLYRERSNLDFQALESRYGGPPTTSAQAATQRPAKVDALARTRYRPVTLCATGYAITDCSNFTGA